MWVSGYFVTFLNCQVFERSPGLSPLCTRQPQHTVGACGLVFSLQVAQFFFYIYRELLTTTAASRLWSGSFTTHRVVRENTNILVGFRSPQPTSGGQRLGVGWQWGYDCKHVDTLCHNPQFHRNYLVTFRVITWILSAGLMTQFLIELGFVLWVWSLEQEGWL